MTLTFKRRIGSYISGRCVFRNITLFYFLLDQEQFGEESRREKQKHRKRNSHSHRPRETEVKSERDKDIQKVAHIDTRREPLIDSEKDMYTVS